MFVPSEGSEILVVIRNVRSSEHVAISDPLAHMTTLQYYTKHLPKAFPIESN